MDIATILFGLGAAAIKTAGARHAATATSTSGESASEIASGIAGEFATVLFAHHAADDLKRMQERFASWLSGHSLPVNQDLERAVTRCSILADLFCLMEALPGGIEGTGHRSWLRCAQDRCPPELLVSTS